MFNKRYADQYEADIHSHEHRPLSETSVQQNLRFEVCKLSEHMIYDKLYAVHLRLYKSAQYVVPILCLRGYL